MADTNIQHTQDLLVTTTQTHDGDFANRLQTVRDEKIARIELKLIVPHTGYKHHIMCYFFLTFGYF